MSEAENMGQSDREILDRAKVTISIAGKEYTWTEVGRRQARAMLAEMVPLVERFRTTKDLSSVLTLLNETLDIYYKYHARMKAERNILDEKATNDEIQAALYAIIGVIDAPFRRDKADAQEAHPTPTPSPESSS